MSAIAATDSSILEEAQPQTSKDAAAAAVSILYLVLLAWLLIYIVINCWPTIDAKGTPEVPKSLTILWLQIHPSADQCYQLITLCVGALGGTLHALRSIYWYIGNRTYKAS